REQCETEPLPTPVQEQEQDGEQRHHRQERHPGGQHAHDRAEQRPRRAEGFLQARQIDLGKRGGGAHLTLPARPADARSAISDPMPLTSMVMAKSARAAYMRAPTSTCDASGKRFANMAASVSPGANTDHSMLGALPTSIARAMVSPSARPKARMIEP